MDWDLSVKKTAERDFSTGWAGNTKKIFRPLSIPAYPVPHIRAVFRHKDL